MSTNVVRTPTVTIELDDTPMPTSHRLAELVQALAGCTVEAAELAVGDPLPDGPVAPARALDVVAEALVRLRAAEQRPDQARRAG